MEIDLSAFQLIDDAVTDMDMLRMSNLQQQQQHLLFQTNTNTFYSNNNTPSSMSQNDCYENEDIFTPLMSPAMTPSFNYQQNINHQTDFQLTSPAMLPQTNTITTSNQLYEQYEQLEQAKLLIQKKLSENYQNENLIFNSQVNSSNNNQQQQFQSNNSPVQSPHLKPATPASLMNMNSSSRPFTTSTTTNDQRKPLPLFQSPVVSSHNTSRHAATLKQPPPYNDKQRLNKKKRAASSLSNEPHKKAHTTATSASPRTLKPLLVSPTLQPGLSEHMLATRSNYQNLKEGKAAALGIAFTTQIKSGIEIRRTAHKAAEQKRRDSLKEWFDRLRVEVEEGYVKRQKPSILSQVIAEESSKEKKTEDDEEEKPLSKVLLLQYAYEYIISLKNTLDEKDIEIENILSNTNKRQQEDGI